jgi:hypothetical protein
MANMANMAKTTIVFGLAALGLEEVASGGPRDSAFFPGAETSGTSWNAGGALCKPTAR